MQGDTEPFAIPVHAVDGNSIRSGRELLAALGGSAAGLVEACRACRVREGVDGPGVSGGQKGGKGEGGELHGVMNRSRNRHVGWLTLKRNFNLDLIFLECGVLEELIDSRQRRLIELYMLLLVLAPS